MNDLLKFYITDVFAERKYAGNQLATFVNCDGLTSEEMQHIAHETNFSETTFIISTEEKHGGYDVRIFTPESEVDFAGHPTLGTAYNIARHIIKKPVEKVVLNLKVGQVPVFFAEPASGQSLLWMHQIEPTFGENISIPEMAAALGLQQKDIDTKFPVQEVSTGLPMIIVPLKTMDALKRISVVRDLYLALVKDAWANTIVTFCPGGYTADQSLGVRVFPIEFGIPEDPATGSGNGCLAAYLVKHKYFNTSEIDIRTGQGYEINRPSILHLKAEECEGKIKVVVGGSVVPVADGIWNG